MAEETINFYGQFLVNLLEGNLTDLSAAGTVVKLMLATSAYVPDQDNDDAYDDVSAYEVASGNGYTTAGKTLTNKAVAYASRTGTFDADDVSWTSSTITAMYGILYDATPAAVGDKKLILYLNFGENKTTANETFGQAWDEEGIFGFEIPAAT